MKDKILITEELINEFAEFSGDKNPIHMDESFAKRTPFKKRIAHGTIILSKISQLLTQELGEGNILLEENVQFLKPVYIGDIIELSIENVKKGEKNTNTMTINAINQKGENVLTSTCTCRKIILKEPKND